jgi:hypothetical protein
VITAELRNALLSNFPAGVSLAVVAPREYGYETLPAWQPQGSQFLATEPSGHFERRALEPVENVIVEGLDYVDDASGFLRRLAQGAPRSRVFALVANGAYFRTLDAFVGGLAPTRGHPLVFEEIEPLFSSAGLRVLQIDRIPDAALATAGINVSLHLTSEEMSERARTIGFVVVADHA